MLLPQYDPEDYVIAHERMQAARYLEVTADNLAGVVPDGVSERQAMFMFALSVAAVNEIADMPLSERAELDLANQALSTAVQSRANLRPRSVSLDTLRAGRRIGRAAIVARSGETPRTTDVSGNLELVEKLISGELRFANTQTPDS